MSEILDPSGNPVLSDATETEPVKETETVEENVVDEKVLQRKEHAKAVIDKARFGYLVAVNEDGGLAFQEIGSQQGYIEMLGLHEFARNRMQVMSDTNLQYGTALVSTQLHQIGELLKVLLNMQTNSSKNQMLGAMKP